MDRNEAITRMKTHISITTSHSLIWGRTGDVMQGGVVDELARWFVDQAYQAGLFDEQGGMHFLERTDGWFSQTGEFIRLQMAARDELEAEIQYLEMYAVPCICDYIRFKGDIARFHNQEQYLIAMRRMPLYGAIQSRL
jgi:hypothetical protein